MTSLPTTTDAIAEDAVAVATLDAESLSEQLFGAAIATIEIGTIHLGLRLGLYAALQQTGPATAADLARHAGIDPRYTREWLEQQAMARFVACVDPDAEPEQRHYELPAATADVLLDATNPAYLGPLAQMAVGTMRASRDLEHAYRTGGGVPFERYGHEVRHGLGVLNGAAFDRGLTGWMSALPDVDARLRSGEQPRILDLGCGTGRSSLALARAYPRAEVRGIDLDRASVEEARRAAAEAGLADRVTFAVDDAADTTSGDAYDLVTIFEALHDMGDPVGALSAARRSLRAEGAVLVADQLTRDTFVPDGDPMERFQYGCSVLHCLPATRAEDHVVAHGTVIRTATVQHWAHDAGFPGAEVLDLDDPFWRFYRL